MQGTMESSALCRVCLASDRSVHRLADTPLEETYERVTRETLVVEGRPCCVCGVCLSALRRCRRFIDTAHQANIALDRWSRSGSPCGKMKLTETPLFSFTRTVTEAIDHMPLYQQPQIKQEIDNADHVDDQIEQQVQYDTAPDDEDNIFTEEIKYEATDDLDDDNILKTDSSDIDKTHGSDDDDVDHNLQLPNFECVNVFDNEIDVDTKTDILKDVKLEIPKVLDNVENETGPSTSNVRRSHASSGEDIPLRVESWKGVKLTEDKREGIDLATCLALSPRHIDALFTKIGERSRFENNLSLYRQEQKMASTSFNDLLSILRSAICRDDQEDFLEIGNQEETPLIDLETLTERHSHNLQVPDSPLPLLEELYNPPVDSSTPKSRRRENQVVTLCEATPQGRALLKACQRASQTGPLETKLRNQLCAYLITQQTPAEENVKLPENHQLLQMSQDIARLCDSESAALYYCPSIARGKFTPRKNTSGWLVNARNNRKKALVSLGFLEPPVKRCRSSSTDTAGSPVPQSPHPQTAIDLSHLEAGEIDLVESSIDQLKGNIVGVPWPTIEKLWSETVRARLYTCYRETGKVQEYLNCYPVLKGSEGWRLLIKDFEALYPAAADGLATCKELVPQIIKHSQIKIRSLKDKFVVATIKKIQDQCMISDNEDVKLTGAIILIGCLYKISPAASRKGGTGSRPEVLKSLVSFVPSENDVTGAIQEHALATQGSFQPFFIAVGEPYNIITSVFFCLTESTFWKFKSFPEAFDAGFKIIHAVACPYPTSCYTTWLAIQIAFYHITTIYDDYSRSLKELLLDLGLASTLQPYLSLK